MSIVFSILFANLLNSIIKRKRFKFDPVKDLSMNEENYNKLKKDLRKYIRSTNFKKLLKIMQKDIDKYFGQVVLSTTVEKTKETEVSEK